MRSASARISVRDPGDNQTEVITVDTDRLSSCVAQAWHQAWLQTPPALVWPPQCASHLPKHSAQGQPPASSARKPPSAHCSKHFSDATVALVALLFTGKERLLLYHWAGGLATTLGAIGTGGHLLLLLGLTRRLHIQQAATGKQGDHAGAMFPAGLVIGCYSCCANNIWHERLSPLMLSTPASLNKD
jgi:hypothetical protein